MSKVANQRTITVNKEPCNTSNLYTTNNIKALDEALGRLQSYCGLKLYMYIAKNQDNYKFDLFSSDFCKLCQCSRTAYSTAFSELVEQGYLIKKEGTQTIYTFYDKAQIDEQPITIEYDNKIIEEKEQEEQEKKFIF